MAPSPEVQDELIKFIIFRSPPPPAAVRDHLRLLPPQGDPLWRQVCLNRWWADGRRTIHHPAAIRSILGAHFATSGRKIKIVVNCCFLRWISSLVFHKNNFLRFSSDGFYILVIELDKSLIFWEDCQRVLLSGYACFNICPLIYDNTCPLIYDTLYLVVYVPVRWCAECTA